MTLPLYQLPRDAKPSLEVDSHRGLWFDKFCDRWAAAAWTMKAGSDDHENPKLDWIHTVTGNGPAGSPETLTGYARRVFDLVESRDGATVVVTAQSRFVTGLGRSHPVENGFAWHPTLGTPYLPGSSAKGLTLAWAKARQDDEAEVARLLGSPGRAGVVAFVDAVPLRPVALEADVLTPHYAHWEAEQLPGDWLSPRPVPFLVAAPGFSLLCGVVPLRGAKPADAATVLAWLTSALDEYGAGAKTAVGYGQFTTDARDALLSGWREERRRAEASATPEGRR